MRIEPFRLSRLCHVLVGLTLVALSLAGCASVLPRAAVPVQLLDRAGVDGFEHIRFWGDVQPDNLEQLVRKIMKQRGGRMPSREHFLAISGGGSDGAFGAGLLTGWSERGNRPNFSLVTGVSTGALIAPFAFLGPGYDRRLRDIYTKYSTSDLLIPTVLAGLAGGSAVTDATPFQQLIERYVTPKVIRAIAREHRRGRRLLVGTTNLDAQRPVIWDMGAIAASGHPRAIELFRRVLQASASIPGVFPPVRINVRVDNQVYDELHVDGGTTAQVFFLPSQIMLRAIDRRIGIRSQRTMYVIRNGRVRPHYEPVDATFSAIAARSLTTLINSQANSELKVLATTAARDGAKFRLANIPQDFNVSSSEPFDRAYMTALFKLGRTLGRQGYAWKSTLP